MLIIIGEAVKALPEDINSRRAEIPWRAIAGLRDRVTHEYFQIDVEIVWTTIESGELDALLDVVEEEIFELERKKMKAEPCHCPETGILYDDKDYGSDRMHRTAGARVWINAFVCPVGRCNFNKFGADRRRGLRRFTNCAPDADNHPMFLQWRLYGTPQETRSKTYGNNLLINLHGCISSGLCSDLYNLNFSNTFNAFQLGL